MEEVGAPEDDLGHGENSSSEGSKGEPSSDGGDGPPDLGYDDVLDVLADAVPDPPPPEPYRPESDPPPPVPEPSDSDLSDGGPFGDVFPEDDLLLYELLPRARRGGGGGGGGGHRLPGGERGVMTVSCQ
jgi:hypothetical protein